MRNRYHTKDFLQAMNRTPNSLTLFPAAHLIPLKETEKENEAKNGTKNEPTKSAEKELTQAEEEEAMEAPNS
ncbi:hypothetical protein Tco_1363170 [Tanacetum coccineum]